MREVIRHRAGKIYLIVLLLTVIGMLFAVRYYDRKILVFGVLPLPFFLGICFLTIWAVAHLLYAFKHWPYR